MQLNLKTNFNDVLRSLKQLHLDVRDVALASALNKTAVQGKTKMSSQITSEFNLSAAKVKAALRVNKVRKVGGSFVMQASLESPTKRGRSLNLINFSAKQTKHGVSVKIKKVGARKTISGAFILNQGRTVFRRVDKSRPPIAALQTIDIAQMFNKTKLKTEVVKFLEAKLPEVFDNEVKYFTNRFNSAK